jgi:hypothetical protein
VTTPMPIRGKPGPRARLAFRIGGLVGVLIMVGFLVAFGAANGSSVKVSTHPPYTWRSGSAVYLSNSHYEPATCTVIWPDERLDVVQLDDRRPRPLGVEAFELHGARIERSIDGPATISCDDTVTLSSGPVLWLYPLGSTFLIPNVGILLIAAWMYSSKRRWWSRWLTPNRPYAPILFVGWLLDRRRRRR